MVQKKPTLQTELKARQQKCVLREGFKMKMCRGKLFHSVGAGVYLRINPRGSK